MDADSIAFFEGNVEYYFKRYGERKTSFKFKFMYERMSERAKKIVRKFEYKDPKINSIFKEITS